MFDTEFDSETLVSNDTEVPSTLPPLESYVRKQRPSAFATEYKSRAARAAARHEAELCLTALDVTFSARTPDELAGNMRLSVWGTSRFERLPKRRQAYLTGYVDGMYDAIERVHGRPPAKTLPEPAMRAPRWVKQLQPGALWRRHPLGGGWVSTTAYVEHTAYVGPHAAVFDRARVLGRSRVIGDSRVYGDAEVWGAATISKGARVHGSAQVTEYAHVRVVELSRGRLEGTTSIDHEADLVILSANVQPSLYPTPMQASSDRDY